MFHALFGFVPRLPKVSLCIDPPWTDHAPFSLSLKGFGHRQRGRDLSICPCFMSTSTT